MQLNHRLLGIIPARKGSKRVLDKNIRPVGGKSLIARTIETALSVDCFDRLVVSSDADAILDIAAQYEPRLALRRPSNISGDLSPAIEYVIHALNSIESMGEGPFHAIAILQPTSPFLSPNDIRAALDVFNTTHADSVTSVVRVEHTLHPVKYKTLEGDRLHAYFEEENGRVSAQDLPPIYVRNGAIYISRREVVDRGQIIGADCRAYVMPRERSIDINDELDLQFAEFLMLRQKFNSVAEQNPTP